MAKYQRYEEYKNSGVEWLGEIPNHWGVVPIKHLAILNPKKSTLSQDLMPDECSFVPMEKLKFNSLVLDEKKVIKDVYDGYTYFENEDILVAKVTPCFENNNTAIAKDLINGVGFGSSEIFVLRVNNKINNRYLFYRLLETIFISVATAAMTGAGGLRRVPAETINTYPIAVPDINEQTQIANFLDYETAQIDTIIEKQQTLIQLLKEKRQAVISHAVTKGLNPDVPMKESGVEWLGGVPEHWEVGRVGYYGQVLNGSTPSKANLSYWHPKEVAWLSSGEVNQYYIESPTDYISYKALKECSVTLLPVGTLVMGMIGQGKTRGTSAVTKIEATINQNLAAVIPNENLYSNYAHLFFQAAYKELREDARGGNQAALNCEIIRDFKITIPPINEQKAIFIEVNKISDKFDILMVKAEQAIQLMQERRTALISAAVTGKIDVRGWEVIE